MEGTTQQKRKLPLSSSSSSSVEELPSVSQHYQAVHIGVFQLISRSSSVEFILLLCCRLKLHRFVAAQAIEYFDIVISSRENKSKTEQLSHVGAACVYIANNLTSRMHRLDRREFVKQLIYPAIPHDALVEAHMQVFISALISVVSVLKWRVYVNTIWSSFNVLYTEHGKVHKLWNNDVEKYNFYTTCGNLIDLFMMTQESLNASCDIAALAIYNFVQQHMFQSEYAISIKLVEDVEMYNDVQSSIKSLFLAGNVVVNVKERSQMENTFFFCRYRLETVFVAFDQYLTSPIDVFQSKRLRSKGEQQAFNRDLNNSASSSISTFVCKVNTNGYTSGGTSSQIYRDQQRFYKQLKSDAIQKTPDLDALLTTGLRELGISAHVGEHPNLMHALQVEFDESSCRSIIVFPVESCNLRQYVARVGSQLSLKHIVTIFKQIVTGVAYLHDEKHIVHRDLKPENIVINSDTLQTRLIDFGLGRKLPPGDGHTPLTPGVVSTWYRPPELLFMRCDFTQLIQNKPTLVYNRFYNAKAVDVWSLGAILAEFFSPGNMPIFWEPNAKNEMMDLNHTKTKVLQILGTPNVQEWPESKEFAINYNVVFAKQPNFFLQLTNNNQLAADLLSKILVYNPQHRLTCSQILAHPFCTQVQSQ